MHRLTVYLSDELHAAICAHADAAGQKLSTFISRELAHLVDMTPVELAEAKRSWGEPALTPNVRGANFRRRRANETTLASQIE